MRILITGASSLPGYRTMLAMLKQGHEVIATYYTHEIPLTEDSSLIKIRADIKDFEGLSSIFEKHKPEVVIHTAAYGDVDGCEKNPIAAYKINVEGTVNVVKLANKYSKYILYLSTDYVFDGLRGEYEESEPPKPLNYYGLTKLCGEIAILSSSIEHAIVRASSIYGIGPGRENFAKFLIKKLSAKERIKALIDQYTTPTQASLLAEAISEIIKNKYTGIFHVVGEKMSRYEFALRIAETFGFDKNLIDTSRIEEMKWFAPRPRDSSLKCEHTKSILKLDFHSTEKAFNTLKKEYEESRGII